MSNYLNRYKSKVAKIFASDFNKQFSILLSGSIISQAIPLVASIFLARIYDPKDFGILALFNGICVMLIPFSSLRYEFAISLAKKEIDAIAISLLSTIIAFLISAILFFFFFFFKNYILSILDAQSLRRWILYVPLVVFLGAFYNILRNYSLRHKQIKVIAFSNTLKSVVGSGFQLLLGQLGFLKAGLIVGTILSNFFGNLKMLKFFLKNRKLMNSVRKERIIYNAVKYKEFPLVSSWGVLLNSASVSLNNFFISSLYGLNQLGFYSYSFRYLNMPLSLVSSNLGQLLFQVCAENIREKKDSRPIFLSTLKKIIIVSTPFFLALYFSVEYIFVLVFGAKWLFSGTIAKVLIPMFYFRMIYSPLSTIAVAFEKQRLFFFMQLGILIANVVPFVFAYVLNKELMFFMKIYSLGSSILFILLTYLLYLVVAKRL